MLCVRFAAVMVAVVLAASGPRPCQGQWEALLPELVNQIVSLWQNNSLEFLGHPCEYSQHPNFYSWELYFNGKFNCPTWSSITGKFRTRSRSSVQGKTIEDFLHKVRAAGLVTDEQAKGWLRH